MNVLFKKTKPNRIFQHVVDEIQAAILDGRLNPGDQLPPEMKLKEMFATSRGTIREALRVLEQKGLINIKIGVGGGAVVKNLDTSIITESLDLLIQSQKVSLDHLLEFRQEVEGTVSALAAQRASKKDIEILNHLLDEANQLLKNPEENAGKLFDLDIKLHITIAKIAGNPVFIAILRMVHENLLNHFDWVELNRPEVLKINFQDLTSLVEAIKNKEDELACALAKQHARKGHMHARSFLHPQNTE